MRINTILTSVDTLAPAASDCINEANRYTVLSEFADVFFRNRKFSYDVFLSLDRKSLTKRMFTPEELCSSIKYDMFFVRNSEVFLDYVYKNKSSSQKIITNIATENLDFISKSYKVACGTRVWLDRIKCEMPNLDEKFFYWPQCIPDFILNFSGDSSGIRRYRKLFSGTSDNSVFLIGFFGRISNSSSLESITRIFPVLREKYPFVRLFVGTKDCSNIPVLLRKYLPNIDFTIPYCEIPYAISACDVTLNLQHNTAANYAGSNKILESMALGVPPLSPEFDSCKEMLGEDYELFFPFSVTTTEIGKFRYTSVAEECFLEKISAVISNKIQLSKVRAKLRSRALFYSAKNIASIIKSHVLGNL